MKKEQLKELVRQELQLVLTEKEAPYQEHELKQIAKYTDRNQHLEARSYIAQNGNYKKLHRAYEALITIRDVMGHTPRGADILRQDSDKDLKKYISKDIPNWQEIWKRL